MIYTQNNNLDGAAYMVATRIWQLNNLIINILSHKSLRVKSVKGLFIPANRRLPRNEGSTRFYFIIN